MANIIDGDLVVRGTGRFGGLQVPANGVGDAQFSGADPLSAEKQEHQHVRTFAQPAGTAAVAATQAVHVAHAAGELVAVVAGTMVPPAGADTVAVDVKKNGVSVLSGVVPLTSGLAAYGSVAGAVASAGYAAGDVFAVTVTPAHSSGTLPQGVFCSLTLREAAD